MAERNIKLGLVGLGAHMTGNLLLRLTALPVDIAAVCDIDPEQVALVRRKYAVPAGYGDYRRMLEAEELDAIVCAVDAQQHYEAAKAGMQAGKYVFVEKTPCRTVEQAEELAALQQATGCYAMVGFNRRFATGYLMARDIAGRPSFGEARLYQAKYHASPYGSEEAFIFNHVVNHLDLARFLLGELEATHAERFALDGRRFGCNITLLAKNGAIGNLQSASVQDMTFPVERVELIGDGGNVIVDNLKHVEYNRPGRLHGGGERATLTDGHDALVWNVNNGLHTSFTYLGYDLELSEFVRAVVERRAPLVHMADAVHTVRLAHQLHNLLRRR